MDQRPRRSLWRRRPDTSGGSAVVTGRQHRPDNWLLILTAILLGFGLIVVYSISPGLSASQGSSQGYFITKQVIAVSLAGVAFFVAANLPVGWWRASYRWLIWLAAAGSLIVMLMPLSESYPAHRWMRLGSFSFQIAELIKLVVIIVAAKLLADRWREGTLNDNRKTVYPLFGAMVGLGAVVSWLQSDLGSAAVMVVILAIMAFVVGLPLKRIFIIGGVIFLLGGLAIVSSDYRRDRFDTFLHPGTDCSDSGYQACQALISVGSGGLMGLGLGYSVQAYGYLPEASNDSIFAIIAEKFGFIGSFLMLVVYVALIDRLRRIALQTADQFSRLVVVGVLAWVGTQMIINVGAMIGLVPLKGITLPLISQGGTSIVFLAAALGIVFQISRYTSYQETDPDSTNERTITTPNYSNNGRRNRRSPDAAKFYRPRN